MEREENLLCNRSIVAAFEGKENLVICEENCSLPKLYENIKGQFEEQQLVSNGYDSMTVNEKEENIPKEYCTPFVSRRTTPRKPLRPLKSANQSDPSFQGVFIKVRSSIGKSIDSESPSSQLIIDSFFTCKRGHQEKEERIQRRKFKRLKSSIELFPADDSGSAGIDTGSSSSSSPIDFDSDIGLTPIQVDKICASCNTSRTPLWRDAEDGTHLCNACGIRWKKYRIRCLRCWYIPRKEEKNLPSCPSCGTHGTIRFTMSKRHIF